MNSRFIRILIALTITLLIAGATLVVAKAQTEPPPPTTASTATGDCASCHADIYQVWHEGAHGDIRSDLAMAKQGNCLACHKDIPDSKMPDSTASNSSFNSYWVEKGKPSDCMQCHVTGYNPLTDTAKSDGISCESCHSPIPASHPGETVPINTTTDLCSTCHTDARFGWDTWKESTHFQKNMICSDCHNPHSTSLKLVDPSSGDASSLCENCHKEIADNQYHTQHVKSGATCVSCHLGSSKGSDDFHRVPDHDFKPKLEACNECHGDQMHGASESISLATVEVSPSPTVEVEATVTNEPVLTTTPAQVSPFGFAGVAAILGVIGGVVWSQVGKRRPRA
jgi:predicted CXXCH cytochrome family protein